MELHQSDFVVVTVKYAFVLPAETGSQYSSTAIIDDSNNEFHADGMESLRPGSSTFPALCRSLKACDDIASNSIHRL